MFSSTPAPSSKSWLYPCTKLYVHIPLFRFLEHLYTLIDGGICSALPWVGFIHQAPQNNYKWYPDLEHLVTNDVFIKSLENCCGLFTLSNVIKSFLMENLSQPNVPVARLFYPITPFPEDKRFEWDKYDQTENKKVVFIGEYLRRYHNLPVPKGFQKYLIKAPDVNFGKLLDCNKQSFTLKMNDSVIIIPDRISDEEYDSLLCSSIVFLDLYDAVANTIQQQLNVWVGTLRLLSAGFRA